jgi:outer membrane protein TolC
LLAETKYYASSAERARREGWSLLSVGVVAGRGDYGETRVGGGLAYAFPAFRSNQVEAARDEAESERARRERQLFDEVASRRLGLLREQQRQLSRALTVLSEVALPAAEAAVRAVRETYEAGKVELLSVLLVRRELSTLALRRLELFDRSWELVGDYVEIAGDLP